MGRILYYEGGSVKKARPRLPRSPEKKLAILHRRVKQTEFDLKLQRKAFLEACGWIDMACGWMKLSDYRDSNREKITSVQEALLILDFDNACQVALYEYHRDMILIREEK